MKTVTQIATLDGRDYITPEDVGKSLRSGCPLERVREDVLRVIGKVTKFGAEDASLCAYVALNLHPDSP